MSKSKTIIFRVSDDQLAQIEKAAHAAGKSPNDWCRDAALREAGAVSAATDWHSVEWRKVNQAVRRLQARIVKATQLYPLRSRVPSGALNEA